jgi:hypothetical protein
MAINAALRRFGRSARTGTVAQSQEPIAVGEVEAQGFNCPVCARPLATGAPVCPGCGTRLIAGVKARLAFGFVAVGLAAGTLLGGGAMYVIGSSDGTGSAAAGLSDNTSALPGDTGSAASRAPLLPAEAGIPSGAVSALRQASILDQRIAAQAAALHSVLNSSNRGIDVARILRSLNTDATFGVDLAPAIAPWPEAAELSRDLGSFYQSVRDSARSSLKTSVSDTAAYRAAGKRMVTLLAKLDALDASAMAIVDGAGLAPLAP